MYATQLYGKREVIAIFLCKNRKTSRKIKVLTVVKIKKRGVNLTLPKNQRRNQEMKLDTESLRPKGAAQATGTAGGHDSREHYFGRLKSQKSR